MDKDIPVKQPRTTDAPQPGWEPLAATYRKSEFHADR